MQCRSSYVVIIVLPGFDLATTKQKTVAGIDRPKIKTIKIIISCCGSTIEIGAVDDGIGLKDTAVSPDKLCKYS